MTMAMFTRPNFIEGANDMKLLNVVWMNGVVRGEGN